MVRPWRSEGSQNGSLLICCANKVVDMSFTLVFQNLFQMLWKDPLFRFAAYGRSWNTTSGDILNSSNFTMEHLRATNYLRWCTQSQCLVVNVVDLLFSGILSMRDSHRYHWTWEVNSNFFSWNWKIIASSTDYLCRSNSIFICSARKLVTEDGVSSILNMFCLFVCLFVCSSNGMVKK